MIIDLNTGSITNSCYRKFCGQSVKFRVEGGKMLDWKN